uniref:Stage V sporulation protein S n=1 Tax=Mucochytrium quahogii TaxID=96639 RepID=A0A7S2RVG6_9STRA|mmetsp:Transcript_7259/g.11588  ORF Transcript_7259/g.11588 Transcript_7259/m.11588 type:complete len:245 (+) Transcript_7259:104-838(+)
MSGVVSELEKLNLETAPVGDAVAVAAEEAQGTGENKTKLPPANKRTGGKKMSHKTLSQFGEGRKVLAVASQSAVKQVAGSIAHTSRESDPPVLSAVGPASVNQAIKAVAVARSYLEEDLIDLVVQVERGQPGGDIKDLILLNLKKVKLRVQPNVEYQNLKSAGKSGTSSLAGAIAKNIRESKPVKITAVGQNPVFRAVDAVCFARKYLADDGLDLEFQPEFTQITFDSGTQANAIQLTVISHKI